MAILENVELVKIFRHPQFNLPINSICVAQGKYRTNSKFNISRKPGATFTVGHSNRFQHYLKMLAEMSCPEQE
jgi:hypothetical protein